MERQAGWNEWYAILRLKLEAIDKKHLIWLLQNMPIIDEIFDYKN